MTDRRPQNGSLLFAVTVFTSAFLLFQVQPLLAKFILPWFGGTPAVWTMCMLVFQMLLFGGYAYAHLLSCVKSVSRQACIHVGLLAIAALTLPIVPGADWKPVGDEAPGLRITLLLMATVGVPYFLLSSTGPLLQKWFSSACPGSSPYRLYALSNTGSLLALISYPFVFEPMFSSTTQAWLWSVLFLVFALSCLMCGWKAATTPGYDTNLAERSTEATEEPNPGLPRLRWFLLAMLPSVMLLATTNEVCMDIAVVPFLWIIPLTLYLLSFILTFESDRFYHRRPMTIIAAFTLVTTMIMLSRGCFLGAIAQIIFYFANLFAVCMLCHGELVRLRPSPRYLTSFYLTMSAGGAAGGLAVGLLAPLLFRGYFELPLAILACLLICIGTYLRNDPKFHLRVPQSTTLSFGSIIVSLFFVYFAFFAQHSSDVRDVERNFYGVLRVEDGILETNQRPLRDMVHGRVVHGRQFTDPQGRREPSTYYSYSSGIGKALLSDKNTSGRRIGVVGLGAGTLAVYGRAGDEMRFYEINPDVISLARKHFTFLDDSYARIDVVAGDARLVLEREEDQQFDMLVLDAFSGDAIPVHLLTSEAMQIYTRHLNDDGILAVHISNSYFDLEPVVRALAAESGLAARVQECDRGADSGVAFDSVWMLLCGDADSLDVVCGPDTSSEPHRVVYWTDDRNNLLNVLR
ncbi:MAG TPA: fused MFS/spermidine synthase [Planctomycetaceae bacterium]|nr:fused MFS/spermidine synthase [Planctomycetaceae bacterium]